MAGHGEASATIILLAVVTSQVMAARVHASDVLLDTRHGQLRGERVSEQYSLGYSIVTSTVDKFLGVPYAKPPVGDLRFRASVPLESEGWEGIRDARQHGKVCPQVSFHSATAFQFQSEDCLNLDIYAPYEEGHPDAVYPVMVFIHGGSFEVGTGKLYDGTVMAQLGVLAVFINYRLGALGFLSSGTDELPGNFGIMDQVQALRWVKENIGSFRGDQSRVTVFGHSAGGASVGLLMILPQAKDLFHGIIAQSGSVVASYSVHDESVDFKSYARQVGEIFDCGRPNISDIVVCLREISATEFILKRIMFPRYDPIDPEFRPRVDGTWITDKPKNLFSSGRYHKVPIVTGTVQNEFANYFNGGVRHKAAFDDALDRYVQKYVGRDGVMKLVKFEYKDWARESLEEYDRGSVLSDMHMVAPTVQLADAIAHSSEVFQYHFTMENCYHSMELNYVFGAPFSGRGADEMSEIMPINFTQEDKLFSLQMMRLWTNFASYGHPTPLEESGLPAWERFTPADKWYMLLSSSELSMKRHLRENKVSFWNDIIPGLRDTHSNVGNVDDQRSCVDRPLRINLWIFIMVVIIMFLSLILLVALYTRKNKELRRYKRTFAIDQKPSQINVVRL